MTILSFATQVQGEPLRETVTAYQASAEGKVMIDYGIHLPSPTHPRRFWVRICRRSSIRVIHPLRYL